MIRTAVLALALIFVLGFGAVAGDGANWLTEAGADVVRKAVDIMVHTTGDNNVRAITHDSKIYVRTGAGAGTWALEYTLDPGTPGNPADGQSLRQIAPLVKNACWPQLVSFNTALFVCRGYWIKQDVAASYQMNIYPEYSVIKIAPNPVPPPAILGTVVLQVRGKCNPGDPIGWGYWAFSPAYSTVVGGYLFTAGGSLYWGGGGGKRINPVQTAMPFTAGADSPTFVYSSADGDTWALVNDPTGRILGNDQYGRPMAAAMPDGYRYSHLVNFGGALWDYYGCYNSGTLAFAPKTDGIHTEPWGWFLMGAYTKQGTTQAAPSKVKADRLARVGFPPKGDKNFLAEICSADDTWRPMGAEGLTTETANYDGNDWKVLNSAALIYDDSLQVFVHVGAEDIELRRGVDYTFTADSKIHFNAPPAVGTAIKATYLYTTSMALPPNDGSVYWRACAGVANPAVAVVAGAVGTGDGTTTQFQVPQHAHVSNVGNIQFDGAPIPVTTTCYATPSGRIVFTPAPDAGKVITADYSYMSAHDGLYVTYSKATLTAPGPPPVYTYESGVYKYNDENYDWQWIFKPCVANTTDARAFTGGIFAKAGDGVYVGTNAGVLRRGIKDGTDPAPVP